MKQEECPIYHKLHLVGIYSSRNTHEVKQTQKETLYFYDETLMEDLELISFLPHLA